MYVLDTNIIRYSLYHPENYPYLIRKINTTRQRDQYISIVTAEELIAFRRRGIEECNKQKSQRIVEAYKNFLDILSDLERMQILPFDDNA